MRKGVCNLQIIKEEFLSLTWISNLHEMVEIFFPKQALLFYRSGIFYRAFLTNINRAEGLSLELKHACSEWTSTTKFKNYIKFGAFWCIIQEGLLKFGFAKWSERWKLNMRFHFPRKEKWKWIYIKLFFYLSKVCHFFKKKTRKLNIHFHFSFINFQKKNRTIEHSSSFFIYQLAEKKWMTLIYPHYFGRMA